MAGRGCLLAARNREFTMNQTDQADPAGDLAPSHAIWAGIRIGVMTWVILVALVWSFL